MFTEPINITTDNKYFNVWLYRDQIEYEYQNGNSDYKANCYLLYEGWNYNG